MRTITLRNLPPEIEKAIEERAAREGGSLSSATIRLLSEAVTPKKKDGPPFHDLDFLWEEPMSEETAKVMWDSLRDGRRLFQKDWPGHKID